MRGESELKNRMLPRRIDPATVGIPTGHERWVQMSSGRVVLRCQAAQIRPWDLAGETQCGGRALVNYGSVECWQHGGRDTKRQALDEAAGDAIKAVVEIVADTDAKHADRLRAAETILDRTGYPKQAGLNVDVIRGELIAKLSDLVEPAEPDDPLVELLPVQALEDGEE
ncbi:MAG: hypothetical protein ACRDQA_01805 [Nocardioidaceae bacterium]